MLFIELFVPKGTVDDERRRLLAERLVTGIVQADGAPPDVIERTRSISQSVVHEVDAWTVGGEQVDLSKPAPYYVRASVPADHLDDAMRAELVRRITGALADADGKPERLYERRDAWIEIVEVPDGNLATMGQVARREDILEFTWGRAAGVAS